MCMVIRRIWICSSNNWCTNSMKEMSTHKQHQWFVMNFLSVMQRNKDQIKNHVVGRELLMGLQDAALLPS